MNVDSPPIEMQSKAKIPIYVTSHFKKQSSLLDSILLLNLVNE